MPDKIIKNVSTRGVGFAPILKHYFEQCGIRQIIDENVDTDPRRKVLTHGQASIAMITGILFQVLQLYRICQFAKETAVLNVILPKIASKEYFDDRLADTLDAIYDYGLGNLEMLITQEMIKNFNINNEICHNDTTTASVYGDCDRQRTAEGINITFGFNKKHRQDLKQLLWSLSVSSDSAFPLFQEAYNGNTADVNTYVEQWHRLIDLLGDNDFLYVADSKLASKENMAHIHDNSGYFICPLPMYASYKKAFHNGLDNHDQQRLLMHKGRFNRGFEKPLTIEHKGKSYQFRMIVLFDQGLCARKQKNLLSRIENTRTAFGKLESKLNQYRLKTRKAIDSACMAILKKYNTTDFFHYRIENHRVVTYKNKHRGRTPKNKPVEKIAVTQDHFSIRLDDMPDAVDKALGLCGYYPLVTNKSMEDLPIEAAMKAHKNQYKAEHTNRRAKGSYRLEPIYLHTPERIEAYLFLFKLALQVVVLIERSARNNIQARDKGLDNFRPNRRDVRNPRAEYLLQKFEQIVSGHMPLPEGHTYGFVSELTELQRDILSVLNVPESCYSYEYLFDTS